MGVPGLRKGHWEPAVNINRGHAARKAWDAKPPFWYREREWSGMGRKAGRADEYFVVGQDSGGRKSGRIGADGRAHGRSNLGTGRQGWGREEEGLHGAHGRRLAAGEHLMRGAGPDATQRMCKLAPGAMRHTTSKAIAKYLLPSICSAPVRRPVCLLQPYRGPSCQLLIRSRAVPLGPGPSGRGEAPGPLEQGV